MRVSLTLDTIAREFAALLNVPDAPVVFVTVVDEQAEDLSDIHTIPNPSVLLSCLDMAEQDVEVGLKPHALCTFVARVYAKLPQVEGENPISSRGDVAMDIAGALIAYIRDHIFKDENGEPVVAQVAQRIGARNRTTVQVTKSGSALWLVSWQNLVELDPKLGALLYPFRSLHITHHMGDDETPDESTIQDLEGMEPPP